jgi:hypothetical protein
MPDAVQSIAIIVVADPVRELGPWEDADLQYVVKKLH